MKIERIELFHLAIPLPKPFYPSATTSAAYGCCPGQRPPLDILSDAEAPMKILPTAKRVAKWMAYFGLACGVLYSFGGLIYDLL